MNITINDLSGIGHRGIYNLDALGVKRFSGVSIDSRSIRAGDLFFAIRGGKFDGHTFVREAFTRGAACAVVDERSDRTHWGDLPLVVVEDTMKALGRLASFYRSRFGIPFIAIAGSNGKTTTKEMTAAVLGTKYRVLSTHGNFNNNIGIPLTLFRLKRSHDIAVIEIGTNHFGELGYLCDILRPTHGLITNIGSEHLEFFRSLKGVAKAEGELFRALSSSGTGFVNADDEMVVGQSVHLKKKMTYGFTKRRLDMRGKFLRFDENGCPSFSVIPAKGKDFLVRLSVPGSHAMSNGFTAAAVGRFFGVPARNIQNALRHFTGVKMRTEIIKAGSVTIVNDAYNANPDSVISALETLNTMECGGSKIVIIGDMLELGAASSREHKRIGKIIGAMGFKYLLTYGEMAKLINLEANVEMKAHYDQKNVLAEFAAELVSDGDIVLVKGSRGMKMEDVVTFLSDRLRKEGI